MPQGRRKTPFSGKAKKEQLKAKKHRVQNLIQTEGNSRSLTQKLNYQVTKDVKSNANRYALQFYRETDEDIIKQKEIARQSLNYKNEKDLEINVEEYFVEELTFPQRPSWSFEESKQNLNAKENRYFTEYVNKIEKDFNWKEISYFELNLETWRQLWRVLEMSDIILFIVDIRFAALMFPPTFYEYVVNTLKKEIILVLNKIDLSTSDLVVAWKAYFMEKYPKIHIIMFTSFPGYNVINPQSGEASALKVRKRRGKLKMATEGAQLLLNTCKSIVGDAVDLTSWQDKIKVESSLESAGDDGLEIANVIEMKKVDTSYFKHELYKNGILTIGCIGQPNVGKSSVMNAIMGKKVVSVSRTPGHTKHFQTIFLTNNVRLCDCPGLVFPSKVPKVVQVIMGSFPIAQLRQPFTAVKYLAEHLNLPRLLNIKHPEEEEEWSAMDICDGWAKKKGYLTAKAARLDSYRAANSLLRMALDGKICLCFRPFNFTDNRDFWKTHSDNETVKWIQAKGNVKDETIVTEIISESSEEDTEEVDDELSSQNENEDNKSSDGETEFISNKFSVLVDI